MRAEPVDVAIFLRHQLHLRIGVAILHVGRIGNVIIQRNESASRLEVAGSIRSGHHVGIFTGGDEQGSLLTDVGTDQILDLQIDIGLLRQVLTDGSVLPGVNRSGRGRHVQQGERSVLSLGGRFSVRSLVGGSFSVPLHRRGSLGRLAGGIRLGGRATGQRRQHHHQHDDECNALLRGHLRFLLSRFLYGLDDIQTFKLILHIIFKKFNTFSCVFR